MRPDLVIFDCDGVLVDSEPASNQALQAILAKAGLVLTLEETMAAFVGMQMGPCGELARKMGADLPEDWLDTYRVLERELLTAQVRPIPGVVALLDRLDDAGVPYCVASNGSHDKMGITLPLCGLSDRFAKRRFSAHDVPRGKPAPDVFLHAAKTMGAAPEKSVVIEDSETGMKAAQAAAIRCFAYTGGHKPESFHGAKPFADMRDAPKLLNLS